MCHDDIECFRMLVCVCANASDAFSRYLVLAQDGYLLLLQFGVCVVCCCAVILIIIITVVIVAVKPAIAYALVAIFSATLFTRKTF